MKLLGATLALVACSSAVALPVNHLVCNCVHTLVYVYCVCVCIPRSVCALNACRIAVCGLRIPHTFQDWRVCAYALPCLPVRQAVCECADHISGHLLYSIV